MRGLRGPDRSPVCLWGLGYLGRTLVSCTGEPRVQKLASGEAHVSSSRCAGLVAGLRVTGGAAWVLPLHRT